MNRCHYCGREYPGEVVVCPLDGEALGRPSQIRKNVTGVWRGGYGYGPRGNRPGFEPVAFTLKLKQGWTSHFTGSVTEDTPAGTPGTGTVEGYFKFPKFELTKQMPIGYALAADGSRKTLREYFVAQGIALKQELTGPSILYQGRFLDASRVQGIWVIAARTIPLPDRRFRMPSSAGYWCAEFSTEDLESNPAVSPFGELFDKTRLTAREVSDVEPPPSIYMGCFETTEAEQWMARLAEAGIFSSFTSEKAEGFSPVTASEPRISIFVRPEDEPAARKIFANQSEPAQDTPSA